ncbi:VOC family protein [Aminobacter aganoensis]|uniref:Catechol 2,3-dioxygenase-like lactoylglutathione lyase family enzyme n=1 Tax=Aminobacter aganoensis TaxID=83264 RepID=A0A7X0F7T8_9HYPH|nr:MULTISPECIES: VOC family protein [Aminobacter]KQU75803.1 glyoxalase [Aminobacter sp. DSM 101952]MBB6354649.1 catechol 2,3-dioxygenase-like lactoylglutathione lyase family enzyme [Aminobacter aganoensis]
MRRVGALRQVALSAGRDIDDTLGFWLDVLGLPVHARYDPPGIAFIIAGNVRLFFTGGVPQATVYLDIADLDSFYEIASDKGVAFTTAPTLVHRDAEGEFGPAGESEWMAFLKDPAGNTIGLVERK